VLGQCASVPTQQTQSFVLTGVVEELHSKTIIEETPLCCHCGAECNKNAASKEAAWSCKLNGCEGPELVEDAIWHKKVQVDSSISCADTSNGPWESL